MTTTPIAFIGHGLDREDHTRADPEKLAALRMSSEARLLALDGLSPVIENDALVFSSLEQTAADAELVFLGMSDGAPLFALAAEKGDTRPAYQQRIDRAALARLGAQELALYGGARSLVDWHARHRFCANCGARTFIAKGGWQRDCESCASQHFPRTDPVAIMLVEHDDGLLLGRNQYFPPRSYSALAGFVEPGESIEEAVAREVLEEAGVRVGQVSYIASQPWPFPSQLMIGCHCIAEGRELVIDKTELEDARWFSRADVAEAIAKHAEAESFVPPPPVAIAHHLLRWWLDKSA